MNSEEFVVRVETIRPMLYRVCCMQLYEPADREDAIQEAIFKAWKKRYSLREPQYSCGCLFSRYEFFTLHCCKKVIDNTIAQEYNAPINYTCNA